VALVLLWCASALAAGPHVVLLRGWFGIFSTGLDSVADQLRAQGIKAEVAGHLNWSTALAEILRERSAGQTDPLVLVGHSQGANNVIDMARSLESHNITVDLLVTLSPFLQNPIPANVVKAINYYQAPGWGQPIVPDRGFHGKIVNFDLADDQTITHISIDKSARVQAEIVREITALAQQTNDRKK
jgi:alpha-beta hydrolase superfamily lysophospholipase